MTKRNLKGRFVSSRIHLLPPPPEPPRDPLGIPLWPPHRAPSAVLPVGALKRLSAKLHCDTQELAPWENILAAILIEVRKAQEQRSNSLQEDRNLLRDVVMLAQRTRDKIVRLKPRGTPNIQSGYGLFLFSLMETVGVGAQVDTQQKIEAVVPVLEAIDKIEAAATSALSKLTQQARLRVETDAGWQEIGELTPRSIRPGHRTPGRYFDNAVCQLAGVYSVATDGDAPRDGEGPFFRFAADFLTIACDVPYSAGEARGALKRARGLRKSAESAT